MFRQKLSSSAAYRWGATALFVAVAAILAALAFEHLGGYNPCPLCLQQRWAYYAGIPVTFVALVMLTSGHPRGAAVMFALVGLGFLANTGLGVYHAGVEWVFWAGPDTCGGATAPLATGGSLLDALAKGPRIVRCDEAPWRFAGLSFAGWNAALSCFLTIAATKAALGAREHELYL